MTLAALTASGQDQARAEGGGTSAHSGAQSRLKKHICALRRSFFCQPLAIEDGIILQVRRTCDVFLGIRLQKRFFVSVAKPDPVTPHGQSSRGAAEGEEGLPTASAAIQFCFEVRTHSHTHTHTHTHTHRQTDTDRHKHTHTHTYHTDIRGVSAKSSAPPAGRAITTCPR